MSTTTDRPTIGQIRAVRRKLDEAHQALTDAGQSPRAAQYRAYALALAWVIGDYGRDGLPRGIDQCLRPPIPDDLGPDSILTCDRCGAQWRAAEVAARYDCTATTGAGRCNSGEFDGLDILDIAAHLARQGSLPV